LLGGGPKPNVLDMPTFRLIEPGPCPKFRGMMISPGPGFGLNVPNLVTIAPGSPGFANAGRSRKALSPLLSRPVVILNGLPLLMLTFGVSLNSQSGRVKFPTRLNECRGSKDARPYSSARS